MLERNVMSCLYWNFRLLNYFHSKVIRDLITWRMKFRQKFMQRSKVKETEPWNSWTCSQFCLMGVIVYFKSDELTIYACCLPLSLLARRTPHTYLSTFNIFPTIVTSFNHIKAISIAFIENKSRKKWNRLNFFWLTTPSLITCNYVCEWYLN